MGFDRIEPPRPLLDIQTPSSVEYLSKFLVTDVWTDVGSILFYLTFNRNGMKEAVVVSITMNFGHVRPFSWMKEAFTVFSHVYKHEFWPF